MKRISGPLGLPHSCAEIVSPSGVFTEIGLYFKVSPRPGCAIATNSAVASVAVLIRPCAKIVIGVLPFDFICCLCSLATIAQAVTRHCAFLAAIAIYQVVEGMGHLPIHRPDAVEPSWDRATPMIQSRANAAAITDLMVRRRVSAVSNHGPRGPSFETRRRRRSSG